MPARVVVVGDSQYKNPHVAGDSSISHLDAGVPRMDDVPEPAAGLEFCVVCTTFASSRYSLKSKMLPSALEPDTSNCFLCGLKETR